MATRDTRTDPIRVCLVMPKAYPLFAPQASGVFGGSEVDLYLLAVELARDRHFQVRFVVGDYGQPVIEMIEGVRLIRSLRPGQRALGAARSIWRALKRADAEIYLTKTFSPGVSLVEYFCRKQGRIFCYRTANQHECDGQWVSRHPLRGRAFVRSLRRAGAIFAQNRQDRDNLKRHLRLESIHIANGHPPVAAPAAADGATGDQDGEWESTREFCLWAGRSDALKRPDLLLRFARERPRMQFAMICPQATGDGSYADLVRRIEATPNVRFIQRVEFGRMDDFFARAEMLVNTSDSEGFPNTFIQAAWRATPILSLRVNPDGFLDRYRCGLCAAGDWETFVGMADQLHRPGEASQYGRRARQYAEQHHDIRKIVEQYKCVFRELIQRHQHRD
ncbi:MAG: glycosyltransferase family 4 protein [Sedimentisphaerales bacterium]|nr:glycosyltransferase family 4 protein [Sedimentisphaerales bacterium]